MKSRRWWVFIASAVVLAVVLMAVHGFPTRQQKLVPTADWMQPLATTWELQSPGRIYSVQTDSDLKKDGADSLRFELRGGEAWVDATFIKTFRAEVATREFPPTNSVKWYAFSVWFPTNFPLEDNRLVFAQWKEKEAFLGTGLVPSLAFRFVNGKFSVTLRHSEEKVIRDPDAVASEELFKKGNFRTGRWHDFAVQVKWSCGQDGFVNIWWNNRQIVQYQGPVGYPMDEGPQFKFGLYRDATDKTYVAWFNQVKLGDSPKDVGFDPATATRYTNE